MKIRKRQMTMVLLLAATVLVAGCSLDGTEDGTGDGTGTMNLSMTDAPIDADGVNGVYITIEGVEYNRGNQWETMSGFDGPQTFNLAALTNGESKLLGALQLPAGDYTQIRFMVGAREQGSPVSGTSGSWVEYGDNASYDEDTDKALFIPSGGETGYKAQAGEPFTVPANGSVDITADFDLRKAVIDTGNFMLLKPVLRLVVDNQAGSIRGEVTYTGDNNVVVYAYETGSGYDVTEEADDPATDDGSRFPNAVTSSPVAPVSDTDTTPTYRLAYLAADTDYDLIVAEYGSDGAYVADSATTVTTTPVSVEAGGSVSQDLDLTQ